MSIFSKLKQSKKAAKEHKHKSSQQIEAEYIPKPPYKHVPTHAAVDALLGAPSSWQHDFKPKIIAQNKRRSELTLSRANSSLSTKTEGRNGRYNSYHPTWSDRGDSAYLNEPLAKRNRISRNHSFNDSAIGPSPLGSKPASNRLSPSGSSSNSSIDEILEMASNKKPRPEAGTFNLQDLPPLPVTKGPVGKPTDAPTGPPTSALPPLPTPPASPVRESPRAPDEKKKLWFLKGKSREVSATA